MVDRGSVGLRRLGPLLAVGLLLTAAALAAMLASPPFERMPTRIGPLTPIQPPTYDLPTPTAQPTSGPAPGAFGLPGWLAVVAQVLCVAIVVAIVGLLLWYFLRNGLRLRERRSDLTAAPQLAPPSRADVIAAVDAGLSDLDDSDTDPRRAVIACWVRLEQAAAAAGTPRQPGDTPAELVTRLLGEHQVSATVLYALAEVYRLARYATHTVDARMRDQARSALQQLRAELAQPAVVA